MAFPDRIERTVTLNRPPGEVWKALTTAAGLGGWFGERATIDLRPGGAATMTFAGGTTVDMRVERVEEPRTPTTPTLKAGRASSQSWPCMSTEPDVEAVAEQVFVALADSTRRSILAALATDGPSTATDLAARLPITRQAVAKHLAVMADAGLVTSELGERRRVRYRLRSVPVLVAQQYLAALAHAWDDRLDALRDYLTEP
jgi:uncharacterized protein YndB with AHSA1/START domain